MLINTLHHTGCLLVLMEQKKVLVEIHLFEINILKTSRSHFQHKKRALNEHECSCILTIASHFPSVLFYSLWRVSTCCICVLGKIFFFWIENEFFLKTLRRFCSQDFCPTKPLCWVKSLLLPSFRVMLLKDFFSIYFASDHKTVTISSSKLACCFLLSNLEWLQQWFSVVASYHNWYKYLKIQIFFPENYSNLTFFVGLVGFFGFYLFVCF